VLYALLIGLMPSSLIWEPLINTILVLVLATIFVPLKLSVQKMVDRIFYGGWYDYRTAVTQITQELEQITDLHPLADKVSERLVKTLRLEDTCVFLRDVEGEFSVIEVAPHEQLDNPNPLSFSVLPKSSLSYLLNIGAAERSTLRQALAEVRLSPEEAQLLESEQVHLWVPIIGHGQVLGLLALGPKYGGDVFSSEDMDILRIVGRQLGPLIENIHLVTRLKRYAAELEKRVEQRTEELFNAKERVEAILASVGDGVVVTDLDWNVNAANNAFERQCGYHSREINGQKIWSFINVNGSSEVLEEIKTSLESGEVWNGELINFKKDGTPYDVQLSISPVRDQRGHMVGYVGSQRDITRNKQLDRLKDQLIFDVSHELRTPVTNLNLYLELMDSGKPEKQADYMRVLKSETNRLIDLIESILDLSRLDMMKSKKVVLSSVDLNSVAEQVVAAHRPLADSAGLRLEFIPEIGLPDIQGEPNQLGRLITNLLSNSIRYTPKGTVYIRTYQENGQACLEVEDTGMGIEPEDLPHLFDRFYRGRKVSQSKITGTGLGLAIVSEIVEIHEGHIEVESQVGQGSTFKVWLPLFEVEKWPVKPY
jgi:two-component system phosphate regulon sensor histidine kinase PhoR